MKIVFTAGGSGGHFYPIIAVAEAVNDIVKEQHLLKPNLYYISDSPYDERLLVQNNIEYIHVSAGKVRTYFSPQNFSDIAKTITIGLPRAIHQLFRIYPDVVFSKGSYASVPTVMAARLLRVPVFVHDSDAVPGRANLMAGKFAERIGISYPEAADFFDKKERVAYVGNPVRRDVKMPIMHEAHDFFTLSAEIPTVLIVGGSQGAEVINNTILRTLPDLLNEFQVIHQVGKDNFDSHKEIVDVELKDHPHANRYRFFPFLNTLELRTAAGAADYVISRAGSGSIYEIASWGLPSILVPIPEDVSRDQRKNAYAYARTGGTEVIEQHNFTPHVLMNELKRIHGDEALKEKMKKGAQGFQRLDAAKNIAREIIRMALKHEL